MCPRCSWTAGDVVVEDDVIAQLETDKVRMLVVLLR